MYITAGFLGAYYHAEFENRIRNILFADMSSTNVIQGFFIVFEWELVNARHDLMISE